ncbi:MAG: bifunctional phosphoribosylaminoimidazolecarboxamide formyltransferase/IMP cyclohydrolase, partial [Deltaproteobacteria bacterium]|nr:bifunctional phosphoribosylaminoimidazolecarboxamide formyltransferase/IMP cyclohydrolase [Deltaproteobacteria bacterium]
MIRRALISVHDKTGIVAFARALAQRGVEILSTGGTLRLLRSEQVPALAVEDYTGSPELMDGRVKTLHPRVHGGILARAGVDDADLDRLGARPIDLVVVSLYPFEQTAARTDATAEQIIEEIDVGGPAMLRAAAKNHARVAVVCDPADYAGVLAEIERTGAVGAETRAMLAAKAFARTAAYDGAIAGYLMARASPATQAANAGVHAFAFPHEPRAEAPGLRLPADQKYHAAGCLGVGAPTPTPVSGASRSRESSRGATILGPSGSAGAGGAGAGGPGFPEHLTLAFERISTLRYGENPHQRAAWYRERGAGLPLGGAQSADAGDKELSFNNLVDVQAALDAVREHEEPAAAVIKHTNPCGLAVASELCEAYRLARDGDPVSAFGGIVALNRPVDLPTAA